MSATWTLAVREVVHFSRAKARVAASIATPAMFWLLVGSGFGSSSLQVGGAQTVGYAEYFFTGSLAMVMLFTSIFSAFSLIEDRNEGFLQGVLVSPTPSYQIALGKVLGGTFLAAVQAWVFLLLAQPAGVPIQPIGYVLSALVIVACSFALAALGLAIAWPSRSIAGFHAVMNLILMPMWLLSGALFPAAGAHPIVQAAMQLNPFSYCVSLLRQALYYQSGTTLSGVASWSTSLIGVALFGLGAFGLAVAMAHRLRQEG